MSSVDSNNLNKSEIQINLVKGGVEQVNKKKPTHQKTQTLPNAAVLLLNEILAKKSEVAPLKTKSSKETPRAN